MRGAPKIVLDIDAVEEAVSLRRTTIYELIAKDRFPKPRQLSDRRSGWLVQEIEAWAISLPVSQLPCPANAGRRRQAAPGDQQAE